MLYTLQSVPDTTSWPLSPLREELFLLWRNDLHVSVTFDPEGLVAQFATPKQAWSHLLDLDIKARIGDLLAGLRQIPADRKGKVLIRRRENLSSLLMESLNEATEDLLAQYGSDRLERAWPRGVDEARSSPKNSSCCVEVSQTVLLTVGTAKHAPEVAFRGAMCWVHPCGELWWAKPQYDMHAAFEFDWSKAWWLDNRTPQRAILLEELFSD